MVEKYTFHDFNMLFNQKFEIQTSWAYCFYCKLNDFLV